MTWTIYSFGDGDLIAQLLQAVALLVNGGMGSLIRAAAIVGLLAVLAMAAARAIDWPRIVAWFVGFVMVFAGLVQIRTTVTVEDVVDTRIAPQVIGDVPLLFAVPAAVSSEVSYRLSLLATALQLNGQMGNGMQIMRPTANVQALLESNLAPGDLRANIVNYLHHCVVPNGSGISAQAAANRQDLFNAIASSDQSIMLPVIVGGEETSSLSCADFYQQVLTPPLQPLQPAFDAGLMQTVTALSCRVTGGRALVTAGSAPACTNPPLPWDELSASLQALQLGGLTPNVEQTFTTVLIAKLWPEAELDLARERMDPAAAMAIANDGLLKQLEIQAKTGQETAKSGLMRQIRAIADGFVYLGAPILLAMAVTPFIWKAFGLYARLFVWLALWGPIQVIANFVLMGVAVSDITGKTMIVGIGSAITMGNLHDAFVQVVQANAIGADVMLAVPGIALALAWGGVGALGSVLGGAAGGILAAGRDIRGRVESGQEVLVSSLRKGAVEYGQINRPALNDMVSTADWRSGWESSVVTQGLQGTTTRFADGRTVTTMRDGSSKVVSPTQEVSITPQGHRTGWQLLNQDVTMRVNGDEFTMHKGAYVRWTGNGAEVDLPSTTDPATGQTVKPRGIFAQDPHAPGGFGALTQKTWSVTQKGLTYEAAQGPDGRTLYHIKGRTDLEVLGRDGQMHSVSATVDAATVLDPKSNWRSGGPIADIVQGTAEYLLDGKRQKMEGQFWLPGQIMAGRHWQDRVGQYVKSNSITQDWTDNPDAKRGGYAFFMPYSGEASSVISSREQQSITVNGASGTMAIETVSGPDGSNASKLRVQLQDGRTIEALIPSDQQADAEGKITATANVSGVMRGVTLSGGGVSGRVVDLQVNTNATLRLPADPSQWTPDTVGQALSAAHVTPFQAHVVDPADPRRTMKISVNDLSPPTSSGQTLNTHLLAEGSSGSMSGSARGEGVRQRDHWVASVSSSESETTAPTVLGTGNDRLPGFFEVSGETEVKGDALTGHRVLLTYVRPDGERIPLGYGDVSAKLGADGRWMAVTVKTQEGVDVSRQGAVTVKRTEQVAPGVFGEVSGKIDLGSGQWVQKTVQIGVGEDNLDAVRKAYPAGPVRFEPGGRLTITNDGQAAYEGPATVTMAIRTKEGEGKVVRVPVQAHLEGTMGANNQAQFRSGTISQVMDGQASTAAMPNDIREFFQREIGQDGKVRVSLDANGQALQVEGQGGDGLLAKQNVASVERDVFNREQNTYNIKPQTAYNSANQGDGILARDVLNAPPNQQQLVARAQANALMQSVSPFFDRKGESTDTSQVSLDASTVVQLLTWAKGKLPQDAQQKVESLIGKLSFLKPQRDGAEDGGEPREGMLPKDMDAAIGWRSHDTETVDLVARAFMENYYKANEAGAEAARKAPNDPRAYHRAFEKAYTELTRQSVTEYDDIVKKRGRWEHGATAAVRLAEEAPSMIIQGLKGASQTARDVLGAVAGSAGAATAGPPAGKASSAGDARSRSRSQDTAKPVAPQASAASPAAPSGPPPAAPPASKEQVAEARDLVTAHPAVKGALATALDQYKQGRIGESLFREQVHGAFTEIYAGSYRQSGMRVPDELKTKIDQATDGVLGEARQVRANWMASHERSSNGQPSAERSPGPDSGSLSRPESAERPPSEQSAPTAVETPPASSVDSLERLEGRNAPSVDAPSAVHEQHAAPPPAPEPAPVEHQAQSQNPAGEPTAVMPPRDRGEGLGALRNRADRMFDLMERINPIAADYLAGKLSKQQAMDRIYEIDPSVRGSKLSGLGWEFDFRQYDPPAAARRS